MYHAKMLDPLTSTAFAIHNARGVYALLLGSGVSRAANVPTGWEVTLDLIRRIAATTNETDTCGDDPEAWYRSRFSSEPDYSSLLEQLAITPAERTAALAKYFEGNNTEEEALKPTKAHVAIAKMVKRGFIRVILTTNFDRLMERALEAEGISPSILPTPDAIQGALPLAHATCTLVKLHGDYRDARLRNTVQELSTYDSVTQSLIDRVLDEYGLIVSGWSATWDIVLRNSVARAVNRRFTMVWANLSHPTKEAEDLIQLRQAHTIGGISADDFFTELNDKLEALDAFDAPHPLSVDLAVLRAKKYVAESRYRIQLYDLLSSETSQAINPIGSFSMTAEITAELYVERVVQYEALTLRLASILLNVAYWSEPDTVPVLLGNIERLMKLKTSFAGYSNWIELQIYPATLCFYAVGLSFVAVENYRGLTALLREFRTGAGEMNNIVNLASERLQVHGALNGDVLNEAAAQPQRVPASERVFDLMEPLFRNYLPTVTAFEDVFDKFEYLCALVLADHRALKDSHIFGWYGRWAWRNRERGIHVLQKLKEERDQQGAQWAVIKKGLFPSVERFDEILERQRTECLLPFSIYR